MFLEKQVTRKEFILSVVSLGALFCLRGLPKTLTKTLESKQKENTSSRNTVSSSGYGNQSYGGTKHA